MTESSGNRFAPDGERLALDDERRVKALSPGMLVFKRFARNKLAIAGAVIIFVMFVFSFFGALVMPYQESQVFYDYYPQLQDYAAMTLNEEFRYTVAPGQDFDSASKAKMIFAIRNGETAFQSGDKRYGLTEEGADFYRITEMQPVAAGQGLRGNFTLHPAPGFAFPEGFEAAFDRAVAEQAETFWPL